jgi:hypothetical protein
MGRVGGNNLYANNLVARSRTDWRVKGSISRSISSDPLFVNYQENGSGDYRVVSGSWAIDMGTSVKAPTIDFAGEARSRGDAFDIGAYEF